MPHLTLSSAATVRLPLDSVKGPAETPSVSGTTSPSAGAREGLLAAARAELAERGRAAISLRAVARRAGVSHAAPKYHFDDRAGLLTAIATEGFVALGTALRGVVADGDRRLAALGRAYVEFGLANPALFDLMFRPGELHTDDLALQRSQREAIGELGAAVAELDHPAPGSPGTPAMALVGWAFAHGLVVLARDGALQSAADTGDTADLAHTLIDTFSAYVIGDGRRPDAGRP